jgi:hypothetical protein
MCGGDMLSDKEVNSMIDFIVDLKKRIRNCGRTNVIPVNELDSLFVNYKINVCRLEKERDGKKDSP